MENTVANALVIKNCFVSIFYDLEPENGDLGGDIHEEIVYKMLDIHKRLQVKATFNIVGMICEKASNLIKEIYTRGHELANHTYSHEIPVLEPRERIARSILKCENIIRQLTGVELKGFRSPQSRWNQALLKILEKRGYEWNAESDNNKQPYYIGENLMRLPITMDDWEYQSKSLSEKSMYKKLKNTLDQGIRKNQYMAFGFHPWIHGLRKERLKVLEEFIDYIVSSNKITVAIFGKIAQIFKEQLSNG